MNTAELKLDLFDKLKSVTDQNFLFEIQLLIDNVNKNNLSQWSDLSNFQQLGLVDAIIEMDKSAGIDRKTIIDKYKKNMHKSAKW